MHLTEGICHEPRIIWKDILVLVFYMDDSLLSLICHPSEPRFPHEVYISVEDIRECFENTLVDLGAWTNNRDKPTRPI